jgi:hypothetical protein
MQDMLFVSFTGIKDEPDWCRQSWTARKNEGISKGFRQEFQQVWPEFQRGVDGSK